MLTSLARAKFEQDPITKKTVHFSENLLRSRSSGSKIWLFGPEDKGLGFRVQGRILGASMFLGEFRV